MNGYELDRTQGETTIDSEPLPYRTYRIDLATGRKTEVEWPRTHTLMDLSRDGLMALSLVRPCGTTETHELASRAYHVDLKTQKATKIVDSTFIPNRFSVDGQTIIGLSIKGNKRWIATMSIFSQSIRPEFELLYPRDKSLLPHACFDGSRPVIGWHEAYKLDEEDAGLAYRFRVGTADGMSERRKTFFVSESSETIQAFDVR